MLIVWHCRFLKKYMKIFFFLYFNIIWNVVVLQKALMPTFNTWFTTTQYPNSKHTNLNVNCVLKNRFINDFSRDLDEQIYILYIYSLDLIEKGEQIRTQSLKNSADTTLIFSLKYIFIVFLETNQMLNIELEWGVITWARLYISVFCEKFSRIINLDIPIFSPISGSPLLPL